MFHWCNFYVLFQSSTVDNRLACVRLTMRRSCVRIGARTSLCKVCVLSSFGFSGYCTLVSAHIPNREFEWLFVYLSAAFWLAISSRCTPPTTEVSSDRLQHHRHRHPCQDKANQIMDGWVFVSFSLRAKIRKKKNIINARYVSMSMLYIQM